jgi:O-antigen/teichoic acid export membrane protein
MIAQIMTLIGLSMVIGSILTRPFLRIVYTEKWATDSAV